MANVTYYAVLPFVKDENGAVIAEEGQEAHSAGAAQRRAQSLVGTKAGAIAFQRTADPQTGEFEDATILGRYGETPADLLASTSF